MAETRVRKWGNSLGIIIPKDMAEWAGVRAGDTVKFDIVKDDEEGYGMWKDEEYEPFVRENEHRDDVF